MDVTAAGTPIVQARRAARARGRRRIVGVVIATIVACGLIGGGLAIKHAAKPAVTPPFQPANTEQRIGYQLAYRDTTEELAQGRSQSLINQRCHLAAAAMDDQDLAIGTLAGCVDALQAAQN